MCLAAADCSFFSLSKISLNILGASFWILELCIGFYEEIAPQAKILGVLGAKKGNFGAMHRLL